MSEAAQVLASVAPVVTEAPAQPAKEGVPPPAEDKLSPKYAALARKEASAVKKLQEAHALMSKIEEREKLLKLSEAKYADFESVRGNPLKAMEYLGTDYNQLTQTYLNQGQPTPEMHIKKLEDKIAQMEKGLADRETQAVEHAKTQAQQDNEQVTQAFQQEIAKHLQASSTKYPLTHMYNRADLIYSVIDHHYNTTGEVMEISAATDKVEAHILKEVQKAQELLAKKNPAANAPSAQTAPKRYSAPPSQDWVDKSLRTLSDDRVSNTTSPQSTHFLNDQERMDRARAKLLEYKAAKANLGRS